ncbi:kinase-like domain-containing protein [Dichomitus squalens]|uniref:Kinase-like domain-containing protein n=1 Tax=Dichomitus squalens TaxID=114155 RepID=A0A4Q9MY50_9APHY|nr:kinase-like domain-containing protein [Dichomitus squalens]
MWAPVDCEIYWRDHHDWLQQRGYMLRPRYKPDWKPSWTGTNKSPFLCDDGQDAIRPVVMDATRVSDNRMVLLKRVDKSVHPYEVEMGTLQDPTDQNITFIVMPHLRRYTNPSFRTIGEAIEFFRQVLEGLHFMHEHHVAHRDCMSLNIMMDAGPMYPDGYHPRATFLTRDYSQTARYHSRTRRPVKYYLTDFGISCRFEEDDLNPVVIPILSGDRSAPEFQEDETTPRNPFPTDVYYLGNVIREGFFEKYSNIEFMKPLLESMVNPDVDARPTMSEVVETFKTIVSKLSGCQIRSRLIRREDDDFVNALLYQPLIRRRIRRIGVGSRP